jgi:hypothetical protein
MQFLTERKIFILSLVVHKVVTEFEVGKKFRVSVVLIVDGINTYHLSCCLL